jgi:hypothetical protein
VWPGSMISFCLYKPLNTAKPSKYLPCPVLTRELTTLQQITDIFVIIGVILHDMYTSWGSIARTYVVRMCPAHHVVVWRLHESRTADPDAAAPASAAGSAAGSGFGKLSS